MLSCFHITSESVFVMWILHEFFDITYCAKPNKKVKLSCYMPWRHMGGEEVSLLLILNLGSRWGKWSASRLGHTLPSGKEPMVPIGQEAGWAAELVWMQRLEEKSSASNPYPVRSQSLYWLSYPGSKQIHIIICQLEKEETIHDGVYHHKYIWEVIKN
jgi:hypothetical protein